MKTENRLIQTLKNKNRTLLEVYTGVLALAVLAAAVGFLLLYKSGDAGAKVSPGGFEAAVWLAAVLTMLSYLHMHRSLDRALDYDEGNAQKLIFRGYLTRYVAFAAILIGAAVTKWIDPLILCLGYLIFMKAAAYMQPYTHKFYNFIFHETDPVPEPLVEDVVKNENK